MIVSIRTHTHTHTYTHMHTRTHTHTHTTTNSAAQQCHTHTHTARERNILSDKVLEHGTLARALAAHHRDLRQVNGALAPKLRERILVT